MQSIICFGPARTVEGTVTKGFPELGPVMGATVSYMNFDEMRDATAASAIKSPVYLAIVQVNSVEQAPYLHEISQRFAPQRMLLRSDCYGDLTMSDGALPDNIYGCVSLGAQPSILRAAVHLVLAGSTCFPMRQVRLAPPRAALALPAATRLEAQDAVRAARLERWGLSERQYEILDLLGKGNPVKVVAGILNISPATVKAHTERIYLRLGVNNRSEAVHKVFMDDAMSAPSEPLSSGYREQRPSAIMPAGKL